MLNDKIKRTMLPCLVLSSVTGILTGALIFLFKLVSSWVINFSTDIYAFVRGDSSYLPLLLFGAVILGLVATFVLKLAKDCRGGGIPTAIASIRGLVPIRWMQGIFVLFASAMITYLGGVPLGNEGPSVQMGTAVGKVTVERADEKYHAFERFSMTGGASAGFAAATGAPLTGIIFALEEAHRRFTPTIFIVATVSVITGGVTQELLSYVFGIDTTFFDFTIGEVLPYKYLFITVIIGIFCSIGALAFTSCYSKFRVFRKNFLKKLPLALRIVSIFLLTAILGFISEDFIGSGHHLIEKIMHRESIWYILIVAFIIRAGVMLFANIEGVSGGIFVPTLTFGAIIAALLAEIFVTIGFVEEIYFPILVAIGMAAFLSASSRTPLTAIVFAAEALCGIQNILSISLAAAFAYLVIEATGTPSFTDVVIETKADAAHQGKTPLIVNTHMVAQKDSFAIGKDLRDILWPPTCTVLSVDKARTAHFHTTAEIEEGDRIHLHYQTFDAAATHKELMSILGKQPDDPTEKTHEGNSDHIVPVD